MQTKKGNKVHKLASVFIPLMLFGISLPSSAWAGYTYTEIIPPFWYSAAAWAINDGGAIVGGGVDANYVEKGFLYSGGNYTEIIPPARIAAEVHAINNGGAIVGWSEDWNGFGKGFLYSGGNYTEIIPPACQSAGAGDINDSGAIVGGAVDWKHFGKGFLYSGGNYTEIIPPAWQFAYALAINDSGAIVGWGDDANGFGKGFLYSGGNYTEIIPPFWYSAAAWAINDGGAIVGWGYDANYVEKGFLYSGGNYTEIIPPAWKEAYALAINDSGAIVGEGYDANYVGKGFLYSGGNYTEIIPPFWYLASAQAINDSGAIVGWGQDANGVGKGFIATFQSVCTYSLSSSSKSFTASGGTGSVSVAASSNSCNWTAISNISWITIISGSSGTGNGMVNYSVSANTATSQRTGTITIAGETLTVTQDSSTVADTINLPQTGQTKCYDEWGSEMACSGTGQDGDIQAGVAWPEPRFTKNADTSITDKLTGLIWASNGNTMPTRDPGWDADDDPNDGSVTWQHALDYVAKLNAENYLGHIDWRLPNVNELESLINANEDDIAAWLNTQGFTNVQANDYWSSTSDGSAYAWYVRMWEGYEDCDGDKSYGYHYVWPVRGGQCGSFVDSVICLPKTGQVTSYKTGDDGDLEQGVAWPTSRFTDNENGTVTDNLTGLMWTKNAYLPGVTKTWQQALNYVKGMNAGTYENFGHTDWRLPNKKEWHSLTDFAYGGLPADNHFDNVRTGFYWSSTVYAYDTRYAWAKYMHDGSVSDIGKSGSGYVWPVRGGQTGPLGNLDISVNKTDSPDPVTVGNNLTYTIVVTNNGPETATGVTVTDTLPSSVTYVSANSTKGTPTKSGNTVTCSIGKLTNGSSATVTIIVKPTTAGTITNTASATCNETDTNSGNNTATATTTVNTGPTGCSTWNDVIEKYNAYVGGSASWTDVIDCYNQYASP